jgi:hypothetical protein
MRYLSKQNYKEQPTQKRRGTGVTAYDPSRAYNGYTLFTPITGNGEVYLINIKGKVVHQWKLPYPAGHYGYLLENGHLFYDGYIPPESNDVRFPSWSLYKSGVIVEVDWNGKIVWEYKNKDHHHDARRTKNGNNILLTIEKTPKGFSKKVPGGVIGSENETGMWSDRIIEVTSTGEVIWAWNAWEHLDQLIDQPITLQDTRDHWPMANGVDESPNGDILVSFRNISTVALISKKTGEIIWKLGHDVLAQQHDPNFLDNGNVLIFDNGTQRKSNPDIFSRVIEVNPKTSEIVWEYVDKPVFNFFSCYISGARRLPNGNTLITEGLSGRIFEVTSNGEVVWEYINPYFSKMSESRDTVNFYNGYVNSIFRAFRYSPEKISLIKKSSA